MEKIAPSRIPPGLIRFGLVAVALLIVMVLLSGVAVSVLVAFLGGPTPTPLPTWTEISTLTPTPSGSPASVSASGPTPTRTRTPTLTPTYAKSAASVSASGPTPTRTKTPTPSPTSPPRPTPPPPPCSVKPSNRFYNVWQANQKRLGCPIREITVYTAEQPFEHGLMFWREDNDRIYVVFNEGTWQSFIGTFKEGDPETAGYSSPPGLQEPKRGFGEIWRDELGGPDSEIGWATYHELGFPDDLWVECQHGLMLWSRQWGDPWGILILYDDGTRQWRK